MVSLRGRVRFGAFAAASLLWLIAASSAGANDYCVSPASSCSAESTFGSVQPALDAAQARGGADVVRIGAGTFSGEGFSYDAGSDPGNALELVGTGRGATVLTKASDATGPVLALRGAGENKAVSELSIRLPSGSYTSGLVIAWGSARHVDVSAPAVGAPTTGVRLQHATFAEGSVDLPLTEGTTGADLDSGRIVGSSVQADIGVWLVGGYQGSPDSSMERTRVTARYGVIADGATIRDSLIRLASPRIHETGLSASGCSGSGTVTASNLTIVGDREPSSTGVMVSGYDTSPRTFCRSATLTLDSSIVRGVQTSLRRWGFSARSTADATIRYSAIDLSPEAIESWGPGAVNSDSPGGNTAADPLFASTDPPDAFRPRYSSPAVDAGNPAAPTDDELDLAGNPRAVGGRRDMGAFEYLRRPPVAVASALALPEGGAVFDGSASSDPDPGDTLIFSWRFDDGTVASGALVTKGFSQPGAHTGTLTVTDPSGHSAPATASVVVRALPRAPVSPPRSQVIPLGPPNLSALRLAPVRFRPAGGGTRFARRKRGATVSYRISGPGTVAFAVERRVSGQKHSGRCVKATRRTGGAQRCARYARARGILDHVARAGDNSFHFTGRIGGKSLRPGRYRLVASPGSGRPRRAQFRILP